MSDTKKFLDRADNKDHNAVIIDCNGSELKRGDDLVTARAMFVNYDNYGEISSDYIYNYFRGRYSHNEAIKCLYDKDTQEILAIQIYGTEGISVNGITVGDSIEKVADELGQSDGYARLFNNGVVYDNGDGNELIIYFDVLGLTVNAIEIYFDEDVYELRDIEPSKAEYIASEEYY